MDERLRSLQREAAHDPEAAARLLLGRVRSGALAEERVALAAHLGHEPARRALGLAPVAESEFLDEWLQGLQRFGQPVLARALIAAARLALPAFERFAPADPRPRAALDTAERWCEAPSEALARDAAQAKRAAERAAQDVAKQAPFGGEWSVDTPELYAAFHTAYVCKHAADAIRVESVKAFVQALERTGALGLDPEAPGSADRVRDAVRRALLAWAIPDGE